MRARSIDLSHSVGIDDAMRRIAIVRFSEVLGLAPALRTQNSGEIHDVRIACKRLRCALERFTRREPALLEAAGRLTQLQDSLGLWHDCVVLLAALPPGLGVTRQRLTAERDDALARSRALWRDAFAPYGPFAGLIRFTGLAAHHTGEL